MPKSIYIDENGNEQILSSSPSALSGLLDTDITTPTANQVLAYDGSKWVNDGESGTLTSPVGTLARGAIRKIGDIKYVSFGILLTSNISTSTKIISLPSNFSATLNLDGVGLTRTSGVDTVCDFYITGSEIQYNSSGSVASGSYVFGSFWYY